jgi:uncharacterized protein YwqG
MTSPLATMVTVTILIAAALAIRSSMTPRQRSAAARPSSSAAEAAHLLNRLKAMAAPTLLMKAAGGPTFSKLGGEPDLPRGMEWPIGPQGPMGFLLQIDLRAVHGAGGPSWLPIEGSLWAFLDERWGDADQVRLIYGRPGGRIPIGLPTGVKRALRYRARFVDFSMRQSCPSLDWLGADVRTLDISDEEREVMAKTFGDLGPEPHHRIGGYPEEIQEINMPLAAECAARGLDDARLSWPPSDDLREAAETWRLLFQIDYDRDLEMRWGDGGHLYVLVREADAIAGDFSRTVTLSDTY